MTPNRPDATCLMALFFESPFGSGSYRAGSSPPSPVLLLPPIRFMAMASASCASWLMEPYDMAPVLKRARIASRRLDLLERDGLRERAEVHQAAERDRVLPLVVHEIAVAS